MSGDHLYFATLQLLVFVVGISLAAQVILVTLSVSAGAVSAVGLLVIPKVPEHSNHLLLNSHRLLLVIDFQIFNRHLTRKELLESSTENRRGTMPPPIPRSTDKPRSSDLSNHHVISVDKDVSQVGQLPTHHGSLTGLQAVNSIGSISLYPTNSRGAIQPVKTSLSMLSDTGTVKEPSWRTLSQEAQIQILIAAEGNDPVSPHPHLTDVEKLSEYEYAEDVLL